MEMIDCVRFGMAVTALIISIAAYIYSAITHRKIKARLKKLK